MSDERKPDQRKPEERKPDPQEAERRLRQMLDAEARNQRAQMAMIQKGFYGCVGVVVFIFLVLLFFF